MTENHRKAYLKAMKFADLYDYPRLGDLIFLLGLLKSGDPEVTVEKIGWMTGLVGPLPSDEGDLDGEWLPHFTKILSSELLDQATAAEELGLDPKTIQRWTAAAKPVPSIKIGRKRFYILEDLHKHAKKIGHRIGLNGKVTATKHGPDGLQDRSRR